MDMSVKAVSIYKILIGKNFSEDEAMEIISFVESTQREGLATSDELNKVQTVLKQDITNVRTELKDVKSELKQDIANLRAEMYLMKSDLVKWTGGMLVAQAGAIVALVKLL